MLRYATDDVTPDVLSIMGLSCLAAMTRSCRKIAKGTSFSIFEHPQMDYIDCIVGTSHETRSSWSIDRGSKHETFGTQPRS